jgi:hypothetical protein
MSVQPSSEHPLPNYRRDQDKNKTRNDDDDDDVDEAIYSGPIISTTNKVQTTTAATTTSTMTDTDVVNVTVLPVSTPNQRLDQTQSSSSSSSSLNHPTRVEPNEPKEQPLHALRLLLLPPPPLVSKSKGNDKDATSRTTTTTTNQHESRGGGIRHSRDDMEQSSSMSESTNVGTTTVMTRQSNVPLSQRQRLEQPTKRRRITASPNHHLPTIPHRPTTSTVTQVGHRASNKWISNQPARQFVKMETLPPQSDDIYNSSSPSQHDQDVVVAMGGGKENNHNIQQTSETEPVDHTLTNSSVAAIVAVIATAPPTGKRDSITMRKIPSPKGKENVSVTIKKIHHHDDDDDDDDLMYDSSQEGRRVPQHLVKYQEVVRKKSEREALYPYDCPDCAKFINAVMEGKGKEIYHRNELVTCSRHRGRHTPPSTPSQFWELSFIDEKKENNNNKKNRTDSL